MNQLSQNGPYRTEGSLCAGPIRALRTAGQRITSGLPTMCSLSLIQPALEKHPHEALIAHIRVDKIL